MWNGTVESIYIASTAQGALQAVDQAWRFRAQGLRVTDTR